MLVHPLDELVVYRLAPSSLAWIAGVAQCFRWFRISSRRAGVAWAASTSTAQGTYRNREINSQGAELMVLRRTEDGWRIEAIH